MSVRELIKLAENEVEWNRYRQENPSIRPDLRKANLANLTLRGDFSHVRFDGVRVSKMTGFPPQLQGASFVGADLKSASLNGTASTRRSFDRSGTVFRDAHMTGCNLRHATFVGADFSGADLRGAFLEGADVSGATFSGANLLNASFEGADLRRTVFTGAHFEKTVFEGAVVGWTLFDAVDLGQAQGLDTLEHRTPSGVTLATIYRSKGRVPDSFLLQSQRGAPEGFLYKLRDALRSVPFDYHSCFISYARTDKAFATHLVKQLIDSGVECWYDELVLRSGQDLAARIQDAIVRYDRYVIVLSANSLERPWIKFELKEALNRRPWRFRILPVRLDDAILRTGQGYPIQLGIQRHVADFAAWKRPEKFKVQFDLLLEALRRS
ncbi:MAG: toll/interleukin-1 receptor domain-containing protein [Planctomycetes bacterium]|nr:toll/interleukin-1 receptor domain-containing protein [Planctomycetota bacterium]